MDDFYRAHILDHYENPRNFGTLDDPDISYEEDNPFCGDVIRLDIRLDEDERVTDVRFSGKGCSISQASASMLTEMIKGRTLEELRSFSREEILDELGIELGPVRIKCALLSLKVLKAGAYGLEGWPGEEEEES